MVKIRCHHVWNIFQKYMALWVGAKRGKIGSYFQKVYGLSKVISRCFLPRYFIGHAILTNAILTTRHFDHLLLWPNAISTWLYYVRRHFDPRNFVWRYYFRTPYNGYHKKNTRENRFAYKATLYSWIHFTKKFFSKLTLFCWHDT